MDDCVLWGGLKNRDGYGLVGFRGKTRLAHRVAWIRENGEIPGGLCVLHKCDNRACVKIGHLFLGTQQENLADMRKKGRDKVRGEDHGQSKLNKAAVLAIIDRYRAGGITQQKLANEYGVSQTQIGRVVRGDEWAWVSGR